jgi:CRISPR-associated protein Csb2
MFAIELEFLTGRYVASRYNDRSRPEWPPHPARLFSALVATHCAGAERPQEEREAMLWLERQGAPHLRASTPEEVAEREPYTTFVPVNDPDVVGTFDADREEIERLHIEASNDRKAATKARALEKRLSEKIARSIAPGRISAEGMRTARSVLPETRIRQPRTFPSVAPADPRVYFIWPHATPEGAVRTALGPLVSNLVRLGHSSSLVRARVVDTAPEANWRPDETGEHRLRIVGEGQLTALDHAFERHREIQPRVLPALFERYTTRPSAVTKEVPQSVFGRDWVVLRRSGGPCIPATSSVGVARSVRAALMKFAPQPPPELLTGHGEDGGPAQRAHLAIVPLPFVGHLRADGSILGIALVLPRDVAEQERHAVFHALAAWELAHRKDGDEFPAIPVFLGGAGELYLTRLDEVARQATLRPSTWCGPARRWVSATPVALDRHPGDLHDQNPARAARAAAEAEETMRVAVAHVGLPAAVRVTVLPAAPIAGAAKAKHFPPFPPEPGRPRRALVHAALEFEREVEGPILLGAGRYLGLGLFRPVIGDE